jgi:hypothetical protein
MDSVRRYRGLFVLMLQSEVIVDMFIIAKQIMLD